VVTALPPLPELTNVVVTVREDSVGVDFDPVEGAVDYRIYPLPADSDITIGAGGAVSVHNAIYRCAGMRQTFDVENSLNQSDPNLTVFNPPYNWGDEVLSDPTLGYVFPTPASDRIPVYAVAGHAWDNEIGWAASRLKIYTTDSNTRQNLISQGWRDDGIVFYVPAVADSSTQSIYSSQTDTIVAGQGWDQYSQFYFTSADLASHTNDTTPPSVAFQVLTQPAAGSLPLMGVYYNGSQRHTELLAGTERYNRAVNQGNGPLWHVEWSGLTQPTILVVEALDGGCPYQGFLSPEHLDVPPHQTFYTLSELQAASATGEVFINGEYDTTTFPQAIARSFVQATPQPHNAADWDWYQGFGVGGTFTATPGTPTANCFNCLRWQTPDFDIGAYTIDTDSSGTPSVITFGQFLGQLWIAYDDWAQDVPAEIRLSALQKANVSSDPTQFLHVTWSVDIVGSGRRYPQLIVSDQDIPVEEALSNPNNNTMLIQTIQGPSMRLETQIFHGLVGTIPWAVNNQATAHEFIDYDFSTPSSGSQIASSVFEHAGMDRQTKFDAYISSQRLYVFMDGEPAGCTQYPSNFALQGPVTVTFGDVLYHEGAPDELICNQVRPYTFLHNHQCTETKRHFDDLGFKSGVAAPSWDENKFPCGAY
jgi:hypothetical protein